MSRILSLDIGYKKTGIAITDFDQTVITPIKKIVLPKFDAKLLFNFLKKHLEKYWDEIDSVVIGNSKNTEFENNSLIVDCQKQIFRMINAYTNWKIIEEYEDFSSVESFSVLKKLNFSAKGIKNNIDSYSAAILLSNYFLNKNHKKLLLIF